MKRHFFNSVTFVKKTFREWIANRHNKAKVISGVIRTIIFIGIVMTLVNLVFNILFQIYNYDSTAKDLKAIFNVSINESGVLAIAIIGGLIGIFVIGSLFIYPTMKIPISKKLLWFAIAQTIFAAIGLYLYSMTVDITGLVANSFLAVGDLSLIIFCLVKIHHYGLPWHKPRFTAINNS